MKLAPIANSPSRSGRPAWGSGTRLGADPQSHAGVKSTYIFFLLRLRLSLPPRFPRVGDEVSKDERYSSFGLPGGPLLQGPDRRVRQTAGNLVLYQH